VKTFTGKTLRWEWREDVVELTLIMSLPMKLARPCLRSWKNLLLHLMCLYRRLPSAFLRVRESPFFSAGGDLRELYADRGGRSRERTLRRRARLS